MEGLVTFFLVFVVIAMRSKKSSKYHPHSLAIASRSVWAC